VLEVKADVYGFRATKKLMRQLEPELLKNLVSEVNRRIDPVIDRARKLTPTARPLSRWVTPQNPYSRPSYSPYGKRWDYDRLRWDTTLARKQIVRRQVSSRRARGSVTRTLWQLQSNNPANAAFELMGRGKSNVNMTKNVMKKHPGTGRVLYRAYDQLGGDKIEDRVVDTIQRYEREFNRRLDAAGGP